MTAFAREEITEKG